MRPLMASTDRLPTRAANFAEWYGEVIQRAKLADHSDVKGCMVIRPNGYAIWENMQRVLDAMFKETGHENAYFPLLIPEEYLDREKDHVEGFKPQLAVVGYAGGSELEKGQRFVIRPTSETIINRSFAKWIQSYRDLPMLVNQWANVMRWEMRTRLFLRTSEFLWQEGHTCHETEADAQEETMRMLAVYKTFAQDYMAMPVLDGQKSESEKFPGAVRTYSIEAMMQDKKALQAGTSHMLGQNFAKMFDTKFQGRDGQQHHVWQTSWGVSTRLIGALILTHSDDAGLVVPPKLSAKQVVIIIIGKGEERVKVKEKAMALAADMRKSGLRVCVDDDESKGPGFKYYEYEMQGVCMRVEIGPKDLEKGTCVMVRRDESSDRSKKKFVPMDSAVATALEQLDEMQKSLFTKALAFREANTFEVNSYDEMKEKADAGFLLAHWNGDAKVEAKIKAETGLTTRCRPTDLKQEPGKCVVTGEPSTGRIVFSKSY